MCGNKARGGGGGIEGAWEGKMRWGDAKGCSENRVDNGNGKEEKRLHL